MIEHPSAEESAGGSSRLLNIEIKNHGALNQEDGHLGDVDQLYQLVYNIQESIGAKLRDKDGADQAQIPQFNFGFEPSTCLMINNMWTLERFLEETKDQDLDSFDPKVAT